jgi:hypothetical protein
MYMPCTAERLRQIAIRARVRKQAGDRTLFNALRGRSMDGHLAIGIESEEVGLPNIREMLAIKLPTEYCLVAGGA